MLVGFDWVFLLLFKLIVLLVLCVVVVNVFNFEVVVMCVWDLMKFVWLLFINWYCVLGLLWNRMIFVVMMSMSRRISEKVVLVI